MNKTRLLFAATFLASAPFCSAEEPLQATIAGHRLVADHAPERRYWHHNEGHFENVGGNRWTENDLHGKVTFHFVETRRTPRFVELFDRERDMTIQLFDDGCKFHAGDQEGNLYQGGWDHRTLWRHSLGYFVNNSGKHWTEHDDQGKPTFHFIETKRTEHNIDIFDPDRKMTIRLYDKGCKIPGSGDQSGELYQGGWER